jgi:predicted metal-dependent HD superfamily phosphohydrolase
LFPKEGGGIMLTERWNCFASGFSAKPETVRAMFAVIESSYGSANRYYHTMGHVQQCLAQLDEVSGEVNNREAVEMALWLHDIIYIPESSCNEELSSAIGFCYGLELSGSYPFAIEVRQLIQATVHGSGDCKSAGDKAVVQDIDLSILGADSFSFACYETAIRKEYACVPDDVYRKGRIQVLQGFLMRPQIYHTQFFLSRYGVQARENISTLIDSLTGSC